MVVICNPDGLHLRPAAQLAEAAGRFTAQATVRCGDRQASARSVLDLVMLAAEHGTELELEVDGPDAADALERLATILAAPSPEPPAGQTPPPKG
jgi:phosphotransferase system HPr (HPr) family protein